LRSLNGYASSFSRSSDDLYRIGGVDLIDAPYHVWVIAGRLVDPRAAALSIRLRDGREMAPVVHDRGFLLTVAADPLPFDVRVLTDEAQLLERFRIPLRG
jgi:hypothetical protein